MKKINLAKKALLPALIAVICSVVALTSVSYAWFTLGDTASISNIDVNVVAVDGIQISNYELKEWKGTWTADKFIENYPVANKFAPVSTDGVVNLDGDTKGTLDMFTGAIDITGALKLEADTKGNYYMFDIYVRLDKHNTIQLAEESLVNLINPEDPRADLAARVAFINLGTILFKDKNPNDHLDLEALNNPTAQGIKIWEPNSTKHINENGVVCNECVNELPEEALDDKCDKCGCTMGTIRYEGISATNGTKASVLTFDPNGADYDLFDLEAGYTKIRVYIWLEGQDADCHNKIASGAFRTLIQFKLKADEQAPAVDEPTEE